MEPNEVFHYTYSPKQQEEVKRIRQKYLPPQEDKLEQLRRLDQAAERPGQRAAIAVGLAGLLGLGLGMCCTMVWTAWFVPGIVIGLAGIGSMAAALPLFRRMTRRQREKLAPEILRLTKELLQEK